jgi:hypothetical protein
MTMTKLNRSELFVIMTALEEIDPNRLSGHTTEGEESITEDWLVALEDKIQAIYDSTF